MAAPLSERIRVLPDSVKRKIAAGEVVEGPFSVVKELVENSLDAGATRIEVQVQEAGLKKIFVGDDGRGISGDDLHLALMEHATSKIADIQDIERVASYGFRGEALSSISSVSRFTILSRREEDETGARVVADENGVERGEYAGPRGTTVIVENLFYNVPARKKFLRSPRAELRALREIFLRTALPNYRVSFALDVDGERAITLNAAEAIEERIAQVYGPAILENLNRELLQDIRVTVSGFLSRPHFMKATRAMQFLFVNRRPVEYRRLGFLLGKAYEGIALSGKHPAAIIFIDIDPGLVDVNIHPAKKEVKLFDHRYIDQLIQGLARKALNREHRVPGGLFMPGTPSPAESAGAGDAGRNTAPGVFSHEGQGRVYYDRSAGGEGNGFTSPSSFSERRVIYGEENQSDDTRIIGTVFRTYMLVERKGALCIIDFHAAHERIIFDSLLKRREGFEAQRLAFPKVMELSLDDHALVMENIEKIGEIGFDIEDFSDNSIRINAVPAVARGEDAERIFEDFLESVRSGGGDLHIAEEMAATVACHAAKRAGERLTEGDMERLAGDLFNGERELRCPHGRPFVYTLSRDEIERMFKRQ
ncbi:MAG: DNA mismatch repair endonuclease MutL [Spirochaetes bacterium]|nr:DNA mismatch repair endonuclease MutL [Spirochaetota bacterium]